MIPSTDVGRFRLVSFLEGCSWLLLLFVAMPLKYLAGMPMAVRIVGSLHGALFVLYCLALARCFFGPVGFSFKRATWFFIASLIPFGAFAVERELRKEAATS